MKDIIAKVEGFPLSLNETIGSLRNALAPGDDMTFIREILVSHEIMNTSMAKHIQGLTSHYDEMAGALKDSEAGIEIGGEDMTGSFLNAPIGSSLNCCRNEQGYRLAPFHPF